MAQASGHLNVQVYEGIVLVQIVRDRVLEPAVISAISSELTALLDRHPKPSVVLDLSQVAYISSAMVGKLIAFYKGVMGMKGRLAIGGVKAELMPLFKITQIDRLIRFHADAQTAIMEYRRKPL
jgi:anti-anti-sigma factor